jgi:Na+/panthothenate symporter
LVFIAISLVIAIMKPTIIMTLMSFSWGTVSGAFIGPFILGLYHKKANKVGAWSGMVLGFSTCLIFTIATGFNSAIAPMMGTIAMIVSVVASFAGNAIGNKLIYKGKNEVQDKINEMVA